MNFSREDKILSKLIDFQCYLIYAETITQQEYTNIYQTISIIKKGEVSNRIKTELDATEELLGECTVK